MRDEYDFSHAEKNPYINKKEKTSVTIRIDKSSIDYFKQLASETGTPYQTLINSFLADCTARKLRPTTVWN